MPCRFSLAILLILLLAGCSANDEFGLALPKEGAANFFPSQLGNHWEYRNEFGDTTFVETLKTKDSVTEFESIGFRFSSNLPAKRRLFMTNLLANGMLHNVSSRIVYNGTINLYLPILEDTLKLPVKNLILVKQNTPDHQKNFEMQDSLSKDYLLHNQTTTLYFKYTIESLSGSTFTDYELADTIYPQVLSSKLRIGLSIELRSDPSNPIEILPQQQVLEVQNFFAENIGLGKSEEIHNFKFNHLKVIGYPEDSTIKRKYEQNLYRYQLRFPDDPQPQQN